MSCFKKAIVLIFISSFTFFIANSQNLVINELMSSNRNVVVDEDGDTPDWIEILNNSTETINLNKYFLSDDILEPLKWQIPDLDLLPNQPLLFPKRSFLPFSGLCKCISLFRRSTLSYPKSQCSTYSFKLNL